MHGSVWFSVIALSVGLTVSSSQAEDLGAIGPTHGIAETSLLDVIKGRITAYVESGRHAQDRADVQRRAKAYATRPAGHVLPRARQHRAHDVSLAFFLSAPIKDADGRVLYPAGTHINPLDSHTLTTTLCFIDADDPDQLAWLADACPTHHTTKAILVNGDYSATARALGRRLYFDQRGYLIRRFSIAAVPAIVRQQDRVMHVEEIPLP